MNPTTPKPLAPQAQGAGGGASPNPVLVVGAGIAGVTTALEAAEAGQEVILIDRDPAVGGRVVRNHHYFPKMCPPTCGMEINIRRLEKNPRIRMLPATQIGKASATDGGWSVTLASAPAYVNQRCTACGACAEACPAKIPDPFNLGASQTTAIRLFHPDAWPRRYTLERSACPTGCTQCVEACAYEAIDLAASATEETVDVSAIVIATGWHPYPLENLTELGGGTLEDVIQNVAMERMVSPNGPTGGQILRPSDHKPPRRVAFVQCAGSRDRAHLPYCSAVCCLASLKQALYVRERLPESEVTIYYIDRRTPGRNEDVLTRVAATDGVKLVKAKVGTIERRGQALALRLEDTATGTLVDAEADLVVLATGMVPNTKGQGLPFRLGRDDDGFGLDNPKSRVFVAGVTRRTEDVAASVRDATGAAAKAIAAAKGGF